MATQATRTKRSPPAARRQGWALAGLLASVGACDVPAGSVAVDVTFAPVDMADSVSRIELTLLDTCDGIPFGHAVRSGTTWALSPGTEAEAPDLAPGTHALYGRAIDQGCRVVAAGCAEFEVHAGSDVRVPLELSDQALDAAAGSACVSGGACADTCGETGALDAGTDTIVPDGAAPLPVSWCDDAPGSLLVCDGFEDPLLPGWTQGIGIDVTRVRASAEEAFLGQSSARGEVLTTSTAGSSYIRRAFAPQSGGTLHFRAHYFVATPNDGSPPRKAVFDLVTFTNPTADAAERLSIFSNAGLIGMWSAPAFAATGNLEASAQTSGLELPENDWFCLEWDVTYGAAEGVVIRINGESAAFTTHTALAGGIGEIRAPIAPSAQASGSLVVFVDELAVSTDGPPGCL